MKKTLSILLFLAAAFTCFAQSPALNDQVRINPASGIRTATALDVMKPYTATGTDTYAVSILNGTLYYASATYVTGDMFTINFTNANATTTPTINVNTDGAKTLVDRKGNAVAAGDIHGILTISYDGTNFRVVGGTGSGGGGGGTPGGSDTQVQINSSGSFAGDADFTFTGGNTLNVDVAIVDAETYGAGWNGDNSVPTKNDVYDEMILKQYLANSATTITDASTMAIAAIINTLTTSSATRTFTISYTGDNALVAVTLNTTASTFTFPSGTLCISDGAFTGDNTCPLSGASGDTYIIVTQKVGSAYFVVCRNFGQ